MSSFFDVKGRYFHIDGSFCLFPTSKLTCHIANYKAYGVNIYGDWNFILVNPFFYLSYFLGRDFPEEENSKVGALNNFQTISIDIGRG